jgi:hypothetical protein
MATKNTSALSVESLGTSRIDNEPSEEQLAQVVKQLNGLCRSSSLEFAVRVGALIIHSFYDSDMNAWRTRGPKTTSFRRLATRDDLPMSAGALYRCVAIFELCDRLRADVRWRRLGASHFRAVLGVPHETQEQLLALANQEQWTVQTLTSRACALRGLTSKGGRRAQPPAVKILRAIDQRLQKCRSEATLTCLAADEMAGNLALLHTIKQAVDDIAQKVAAQRK